VLDSTAGKGIVHKNMVARNKSRLAAAVKAMA
jgi:ribosomal protein S20